MTTSDNITLRVSLVSRIGVDGRLPWASCAPIGFVIVFSIVTGLGDRMVFGQDAANWPQWRGPHGTGSSHVADPPTFWNEEENVAWKVAIPGKGHSTPIIWNDRLYLTTAQPIGEAMPPRYSKAPGAHDNDPVTHQQRFIVLCLDTQDGTILWQRTVRESIPHEGGHYTSTFASPSPVTDGKTIAVSFGSQGIFGLSNEGEILWERDLGEMQIKHGHGEGSSLALWNKIVIANWDHEGKSFIVAFALESGRELWRVARDEVTSWSSPIVVEVNNQPQVIVSGTQRVRGYDLETGDVVWECGGLSHNVVASPVSDGERVIVGSSYEKRAMFSIKLAGAKGDLTGTEYVEWERMRGTPYVPSPLLYDNTLYFLRHYQGILTRVNATTGEELPGPLRLGGLRDVYASPVAAKGRVYITGMEGVTLVMAGDEVPRLLSANRLNDRFSASAALAGDAIYLRGETHLYKLQSNSE